MNGHLDHCVSRLKCVATVSAEAFASAALQHYTRKRARLRLRRVRPGPSWTPRTVRAAAHLEQHHGCQVPAVVRKMSGWICSHCNAHWGEWRKGHGFVVRNAEAWRHHVYLKPSPISLRRQRTHMRIDCENCDVLEILEVQIHEAAASQRSTKPFHKGLRDAQARVQAEQNRVRRNHTAVARAQRILEQASEMLFPKEAPTVIQEEVLRESSCDSSSSVPFSSPILSQGITSLAAAFTHMIHQAAPTGGVVTLTGDMNMMSALSSFVLVPGHSARFQPSCSPLGATLLDVSDPLATTCLPAHFPLIRQRNQPGQENPLPRLSAKPKRTRLGQNHRSPTNLPSNRRIMQTT